MKKIEIYKLLLLSITFFISTNCISQNSDWVWAKSGGSADADQGSDICIDHSGNLIVTGYFYSTATFGDQTVTSNGRSDIFVAKYNPSGDLIWIKTAGGTGPDECKSVAVDKYDNVFIAGSFNYTIDFGDTQLTNYGNSYDVFLAKYDADGKLLWVKQGGGTGADMAYGLAVDDWDNVVIVGNLNGPGAFDGITLNSTISAYHLFIAKFDNNGKINFAKSFEGRFSFAKCVTTDQYNNIIVAGGFKDTLTVGNKKHIAIGYSDPFVIKLSKDGDVHWSNTPTSDGQSDQFNGVTADENDNIYLTGTFSKTLDFGTASITCEGGVYVDAFVCKYDSAGVFKWAQKIGGTDFDQGFDISCNNQYVFVTGFVKKTIGNGCDIFWSSYDYSGNIQMMMVNGGNFDDYGRGISTDVSGNVYLAGDFNTSIYFSSKNLTGQDCDVFVAKYGVDNPPPVVILKQPSNFEKCAGEDVIFTIHAKGNNLKYQWKFNENEINGATDSFLTLKDIKSSDAGYYRCKVSDTSYFVNSNEGQLTVGTGVLISDQPQNKTIEKGKSVKFEMTVSGLHLQYQWQKNGVDIHNAKEPFLNISSTNYSDSGYYRCIISDMCGVDTTEEALLKVIHNTGLAESANNGISIYPNPTRNFVNISISGNVPETLNIKLFRTDGKLLREQTIQNELLSEIRFPLDGIEKGIYLLQISTDTNNFIKNLIIL